MISKSDSTSGHLPSLVLASATTGPRPRSQLTERQAINTIQAHFVLENIGFMKMSKSFENYKCDFDLNQTINGQIVPFYEIHIEDMNLFYRW